VILVIDAFVSGAEISMGSGTLARRACLLSASVRDNDAE